MTIPFLAKTFRTIQLVALCSIIGFDLKKALEEAEERRQFRLKARAWFLRRRGSHEEA